MERQENFGQESLMFLFERKGKSIDDASKNFEKLSNTIMALVFVNKAEKDVVDGPPNKGSEI